jgi:hypothetical protein
MSHVATLLFIRFRLMGAALAWTQRADEGNVTGSRTLPQLFFVEAGTMLSGGKSNARSPRTCPPNLGDRRSGRRIRQSASPITVPEPEQARATIAERQLILLEGLNQY